MSDTQGASGGDGEPDEGIGVARRGMAATDYAVERLGKSGDGVRVIESERENERVAQAAALPSREARQVAHRVDETT